MGTAGRYLRLTTGNLSVELAPEVGGSVASFRLRTSTGWLDLMRAMCDEDHAKRNARGAAMFPMVPYANRIPGNCLSFGGRSYRLSANLPGEPLNLHGTGWQSPWVVSAITESAVTLILDETSESTPYTYRAYQVFELARDRLIVTLGVRNCGQHPMPFGLGLHPYWLRDPKVRVQFRASHFWLSAPDRIPTDRIQVPPELNFQSLRELPNTWRDNDYGGWDGLARVEWSHQKLGLLIEADPVFRHLMFYSDPGEGAFCLEPQTHLVGAFSREDHDEELDLGTVVLVPGELLEGSVAFVPYAVSSIDS